MPTTSLTSQQTGQTTRLLGMGVKVFIHQVRAGHWVEQLLAVGQGVTGGTAVSGNAVHPCYINDQATLVHAADLASRDPAFYAELEAFAGQRGYVLFADRRSRDLSVASERRGSLLPVVVFSLGLGSAAMAAEPSQPVGQTLALFDSQLDARGEEAMPDHDLEQIDFSRTEAQSVEVVREVESILRDHYVAADNAPDYIETDLAELADYFAHYPQAVALLRSIAGRAWQLSYVENTFSTEVRGSGLQIHSVTVSFDTRAAAQLRRHKACVDKPGACVASPADAMLHELLHAASALLDPRRFIAQGGLNAVIYPFEHESDVIRQENALYRAMSAVDGHFRPHRHRHSGQVVASTCVTCLK